MRIDESEKSAPLEMILPLINVVFLLLIFLMLMGRVSERPALDIDPAKSAQAEEHQQSLTLYVDAEGNMQFRSLLEKDEILSALKAEFALAEVESSANEKPEISIRADADADLSKVIYLAREIQAISKGTLKLEVLQQ